MDNETKQIIIFATALTLFFGMIFGGITYETKLKVDAIVKMVENGADPLQAAAALNRK